MSRNTVILDCDPGIDDALAIFCAARYSNLLAITTVSGNVSVDKTTHNALAITQIAGIDVPIHRGAPRPLTAPPLYADHVHGSTGLADVELPPLTRTTTSDDAIGFLCDITRRRDDIDLVAVGPLTNVALAVQADPRFADRLRSLTIMGGAISTGNVTAVAEFNIWADPEAAHVVAEAGIRPRFVTLDITHQVCADLNFIAALRRADTGTSRFAADLVEFCWSTEANVHGALALHDPVALLACTHPGLFGLRARRVAIETAGEYTRGMTVVDERSHARESDANAHVVTAVDHREAIGLIVDACIDPCATLR